MKTPKPFQKLLDECRRTEQKNLQEILQKVTSKSSTEVLKKISGLKTTEWATLLNQYNKDPKTLDEMIRFACGHKVGYLDSLPL